MIRLARFARFASITLLFAAGCASLPGIVEEEPPPPPKPLEPFRQSMSWTDLTFEMRPVPAGTVVVQGETIEVRPFWVAKTETTWDFYDVFVYELDKQARGENDEGEPEADAVTRPSRPYVAPDRGFGHQGYAAISLASQNAVQFAKWLSAKTGRRFFVPTEAEWRHICALSGITPETADEFAWHDGNADFEPHTVGTKKADALGVHDLWGNVREWVQARDGTFVAMGGAFWDLPDEIGCAARHEFEPDWQMTDPQVPKSPWWLSDAPFMGVRVVCLPDGGGDQTRTFEDDDAQRKDEDE